MGNASPIFDFKTEIIIIYYNVVIIIILVVVNDDDDDRYGYHLINSIYYIIHQHNMIGNVIRLTRLLGFL